MSWIFEENWRRKRRRKKKGGGGDGEDNNKKKTTFAKRNSGDKIGLETPSGILTHCRC